MCVCEEEMKMVRGGVRKKIAEAKGRKSQRNAAWQHSLCAVESRVESGREKHSTEKNVFADRESSHFREKGSA